MRRLVLAAALVLALPRGAAAQMGGPAPDRDPVGFFAAALRYRLDVLDVSPYGAAALFGRDFQPLTLDLRFDLHRRCLHVRWGVGDAAVLAFGVRADVTLEGLGSRVRARLDLGVGGHGLSLRLPDVIVVPRYLAGRPVVEVQVPLIEKRF